MRDLKYLKYFEDLLQQANNALVEQAKADGKVCVAYTCENVPEPLLNLDRAVSIRLSAPNTGSLDIATYYMTNLLCEPSRALLERAIEGGFNFADCVITPDGCTMMNRAVENMELLKTMGKDNPNFFHEYMEIAFKNTDNDVNLAVLQCRNHILTPLHEKYGIDILWIGARTTANPFAVQALADALQGVDNPVLVKNPVNPDLELWIGALERINNAGVKRMGAIHRGFSSYDKKIYRNLPMWQIPIELHRRIPNIPICCDPSHIGGRRDLIAPLCQQALDLGMDGLIVESHCNPDAAWSDASQQVTPDILDYILSILVIREKVVTTENIIALRKQIDEIDDSLIDLLAKRMRISREIGQYKKEHSMTIVQTSRYNEILEKRGAQGSLMGIGAECIKEIFETIHEESVRQQVEVMK